MRTCVVPIQMASNLESKYLAALLREGRNDYSIFECKQSFFLQNTTIDDGITITPNRYYLKSFEYYPAKNLIHIIHKVSLYGLPFNSYHSKK